MNAAVALIVFNRPDTTRRVFDAIAEARPKKLFVIADGPRPGVVGDAEKCALTRAIVDRVDWPCEIFRNFADDNLGVGVRPATGIRWVFEHVEEAIVLEDDCLADSSFFTFCEELLDRYRHDERIMHISGDNWNFGTPPFSYLYCCYCYSCGWATWRRAFRHYDPDLTLWPELRDTSWLRDLLGDVRAAAFWAEKFDLARSVGLQRTGWDWPWLFACWAHHGLSILPKTNLVSNIGFDAEATHTRDPDDPRAGVPTVEMTFPLEHPPYMVRDAHAEQRIFEQVGLPPEPQDLYHRLRRRCLAAMPDSMRSAFRSYRSAPSHR
jgi:hypothetical protein